MSYWGKMQTHRIHRRAVLAGSGRVGLGLAGLALIGCGESEDSDGTASPIGTGTASSGGSGGGGVPVSGGILNMSGAASAPDVFDPAITILGGSYALGVNKVYSRLIRYDSGGVLQPDIAELPEIVDDTTYIFKIKPNVHWHDIAPASGRQFTAEDAKWGLERFTRDNPEFIHGAKLEPIESIEVVDDLTFRVTTKFPFAPILQNLADDGILMVNRENEEAVGEAGIKEYDNLLGTGPFVRGELRVGSGSHLTRNPNYYDEPEPYLERINFIPLADSAATEAAFRSKQIDTSGFITGWRKLAVEQVQQELGEDAVATSPKVLNATYDVNLHNESEFFSDPRVRKAIHLAANRQQFQAAWGKESGLLMTAVPQFMTQYGLAQEQILALPGYRPDKEEDIAEAKRLLEAAGFADGFSVGALVQEGIGAHGVPLRENLLEIGIDLQLREVPVTEWIVARQRGEYDVVIASNTGAMDPSYYLYDRFHSGSAQNFDHYNSAEFDALAEKQRSTVDPDERAEIIRQADELLLEDVPHVFSANIMFHPVWWSYLKDVKIAAGLTEWTSQLWIDSDEKQRLS